jgi:hypothetical protein
MKKIFGSSRGRGDCALRRCIGDLHELAAGAEDGRRRCDRERELYEAVLSPLIWTDFRADQRTAMSHSSCTHLHVAFQRAVSRLNIREPFLRIGQD